MAEILLLAMALLLLRYGSALRNSGDFMKITVKVPGFVTEENVQEAVKRCRMKGVPLNPPALAGAAIALGLQVPGFLEQLTRMRQHCLWTRAHRHYRRSNWILLKLTLLHAG